MMNQISNNQTPTWEPIETAPMDGKCILKIETDEGEEVAILKRDYAGNWLYEGEPTFCLSYYYKPVAWMPLPNTGDKS